MTEQIRAGRAKTEQPRRTQAASARALRHELAGAAATSEATANPETAGADAIEGAEAAGSAGALWAGDTGTLYERSRRTLLELVRGPYLSRARSSQNWSALLADEAAIRSRLNDLFLELVIDREGEFAFVRNAESTEIQVPRAVRAEALTVIDTAMLLALRHTLLNEEGRGRVIIGQDELYETLDVYRTADRDQTDFRKRLNASWSKMVNKLRVLHVVGDDRAEISPVVRMLIDADQIDALQASYATIAEGATP